MNNTNNIWVSRRYRKPLDYRIIKFLNALAPYYLTAATLAQSLDVDEVDVTHILWQLTGEDWTEVAEKHGNICFRITDYGQKSYKLYRKAAGL